VEELVSEPLKPLAGTFGTRAMAAGLPGLPAGFAWRGETHRIETVLESWKESGPEHGRLSGERYLRRHCFRLRMSDASVWRVYFTRQPAPGASPKARWFLYSVKRGQPDCQDGAS
jgi:hypothetical protein